MNDKVRKKEKRDLAHREADKARKQQQKCRAKAVVPKNTERYKSVVNKLVKGGLYSPSKSAVLHDVLAKNELHSLVVLKDNPVLMLNNLKQQNRVAEQEKLVQQLSAKYGSLRRTAKVLSVHWSTLQRLSKPKVKRLTNRKKVFIQRKEELSVFYRADNVSTSLPGARQSSKKFLLDTLEESYKKYKANCIANGQRPMSFSNFCKFRPRDVYIISKTPKRVCVCELCDDFHNKKKVIQAIPVKGLEGSVTELVRKSLCFTDFSVLPYGKIDCINRSCNNCGKKQFLAKIKQQNPGLMSRRLKVKWLKWSTYTDENAGKRMEPQEQHGTIKELIDAFLDDLQSLSLHLFNAQWNRNQFQSVKDNLEPGHLLQVMDFAQNYLNTFQDEPQSVHWVHTQTSLHPIINFYRCPKDNKLITEEHMFVTPDKTHDKYAVQTFEKLTLQHLAEKGIVPKAIIQFSDNCSSQYKSKGPFQFLSSSNIPIVRAYFGARHAKNPADGCIGQCKKAANLVKFGRKAIIRDAKDFYHVMVNSFCKNIDPEQDSDVEVDSDIDCQHFVMNFFFVDRIERSEVITAQWTKGSSLFHSVRSTGVENVIEAHPVLCLCRVCLLLEDEICCPNSAYADKWIQYNLSNGKQNKGTSCVPNTHWVPKIETSLTSVTLVTLNTSSTGNVSNPAQSATTVTNSVQTVPAPSVQTQSNNNLKQIFKNL